MSLISVEKFAISLILSKTALKGDFLEFLLSDGLPGYLLYLTVLSGLPMGYPLLVACQKSHMFLLSRKSDNIFGYFCFEKICYRSNQLNESEFELNHVVLWKTK